MNNTDNFNSGNGWTQYQKLVLSELERHEAQMDVIKKDIVEIKLTQRELSADMHALQKSLAELNNTLKDYAIDRKITEKEYVKQQIDIKSLKLRFGFLCAIIGLISGSAGSSMMEFVIKLFGGH
jgi:hypothetical protein